MGGHCIVESSITVNQTSTFPRFHFLHSCRGRSPSLSLTGLKSELEPSITFHVCMVQFRISWFNLLFSSAVHQSIAHGASGIKWPPHFKTATEETGEREEAKGKPRAQKQEEREFFCLGDYFHGFGVAPPIAASHLCPQV